MIFRPTRPVHGSLFESIHKFQFPGWKTQTVFWKTHPFFLRPFPKGAWMSFPEIDLAHVSIIRLSGPTSRGGPGSGP